ncbi:hypothetical protein Slala05_63630 [Streptomyces lavendulae subsp. lavendulae]|nr:hypothetical protein Slala05_63630 [Streptomyces lavendulae subsp. lavendulae]
MPLPVAGGVAQRAVGEVARGLLNRLATGTVSFVPAMRVPDSSLPLSSPWRKRLTSAVVET